MLPTTQTTWTRRLLRAAIAAYTEALIQHRKSSDGDGPFIHGLCWAFAEADRRVRQQWPDTPSWAIASAVVSLQNRMYKYRSDRLWRQYDPYWWSFGPSGIRARRRVLRNLCVELRIDVPPAL